MQNLVAKPIWEGAGKRRNKLSDHVKVSFHSARFLGSAVSRLGELYFRLFNEAFSYRSNNSEQQLIGQFQDHGVGFSDRAPTSGELFPT